MVGSNTYLLRTIREELIIHGYSYRKYEDFFRSITDVLDEKTLEYCINNAKRWLKPRIKYHKKDKDNYGKGKMNKDELKGAISRFLGFPLSLWEEQSDEKQKEDIKKYISIHLDKENNMLKKLNLPSDKELKRDLNKEEKKLFQELKQGKAKTFKRITHDNMNLSQEMLIAMLHLAYEFGYYQHLVNYIFPQLKTSNQLKTEILFIYANALGSHQLKEYKEASLILERINTEDNLSYIDTQTAMTSNFLRHLIGDNINNLNEDELRDIVYSQSKNYKALFYKDETHHYYPAINYGYMIAIAKQLYPKDKEFKTLNNITIQELLKLSQKSINEDKDIKDNKDANYYASMTELEFSLIRNINTIQKIGVYLEKERPDITLVSRTLRQIIFFRDILEQSIDEVSFDVDKLESIIDTMEGYIRGVE